MKTSLDKDPLVLVKWTVFSENFYSLELLQIESTFSTVRKTRLLPEQCKLNISVAVFTCLDLLTVNIEYGHLCMFSFQSVKYNLLFNYML